MLIGKRQARRICFALMTALVAALSFAVAAYAAGDFTANGKALTASEETTTGTVETAIQFLAPAIGLNIKCPEGHEVGVVLGTGSTPGVSHVVRRFLNCVAFDNKGIENKTCVVPTIEASGLLLIVKINGVIVRLLLEPNKGKKALTVIKLNNAVGKECTLEPEYEVSGTELLIGTEGAGAGGLELLTTEASASESKEGADGLLVGTHPMTIDGSMLSTFSGALKGSKLGFIGL